MKFFFFLLLCIVRGNETISIDVVIPDTTTIVLHAHQLTVGADVKFTSSKNEVLSPIGINYDLVAQTITFTFKQSLTLGKGTLFISFVGTLNDELAGFYRSKYTVTRNGKSETRYMAVTQFEATDARRCFPCVDEPAAKASYKLTVEAPYDRQVISNMHPIKIMTSDDGKLKTHVFAETPIMSTYLVAIIVGEFDTVSGISKCLHCPTTIYCPLGKSDQGKFGLQIALDSIDFLQQIFATEYMGTKSDLIAIPDFAAGAMENLGCVTYREAALLIDEKQSALSQRQRVAQVIAHELSHQWFGNLVTMDWWTYLWLNEGFAKHMEYVVTNHLFPEWNVWSIFTATVQSHAFQLDALNSTHPIEVEVKNPDEINEIFDTISYMKGATVIRMLFAYLSHDIAFKGLTHYLNHYKYKNTVTEDLWTSLELISNQPIKSIMKNWTSTCGYPYLYVAPSSNGKGYELQSKRFIASWASNPKAWPTAADFPNGGSVSAAMEATKQASTGNTDATKNNDDWCLPITVVVGDKENKVSTQSLGVLMLDPAADASVSRTDKLSTMANKLSTLVNQTSFFKINAGNTNFYRVIYDICILPQLMNAVYTPTDSTKRPLLDINDRLGLVGDIAAGVSTGMLPASALLKFLPAFINETEYSVWVVIIDAISDLRTSCLSLNTETSQNFDSYIRKLLTPVINTIGWDPKSTDNSSAPLLRALVLRIGAVAGMDDVVQEALKRFDAYVGTGNGDGQAIAPDVRQLVYNTAASHGGSKRWEALLRLLKAATLSEEQRRLMMALGRQSDIILQTKTLDLVFDGTVCSQDCGLVFSSVASAPGPSGTGRDLVWNYLKTNWDKIHKLLGGGNFIWGQVVGACTGYFDNQTKANDIEEWFTTHPMGSAERTVKQSLEAIRTRAWKVHLLQREEKDWNNALNESFKN